MGIFKRNRTFLLGAVLILVIGALLFGGVIAVRVMAESSATPAPAATQPASYNSVSSYGMTGYPALTLEPTAETPDFITKRLDEGRGIVLLVYVKGASDDMEMLSSFNDIKANYAADSSFFSFEARESKQLGDTLMQLRVSDPPILAIIRGDGTVANMYTGWIGFKVMEQEIADAVRGL
ncbi:MAG TPA: hypothetical protein VFZ86_10045 [Thermoleophilia bacterium]|jgi:hypothetical protein|nr:hypothetical protein [Thermoleophilia bacterium]